MNALPAVEWCEVITFELPAEVAEHIGPLISEAFDSGLWTGCAAAVKAMGRSIETSTKTADVFLARAEMMVTPTDRPNREGFVWLVLRFGYRGAMWKPSETEAD